MRSFIPDNAQEPETPAADIPANAAPAPAPAYAPGRKKRRLSAREITVFAMFGAIMFCSKLLMEALPNIHLVGMFTVMLTVVYRKKALFPIYVYVFLCGLFEGFTTWWVPYLYVWTVLWGAVMLLPRSMGKRAAAVVYPVVCGLHGLLFGTLFAPAQALMFGLDFHQTLAWIAAGLPFDAIHAVSNTVAGLLILPFSRVVSRLDRRYIRS